MPVNSLEKDFIDLHRSNVVFPFTSGLRFVQDKEMEEHFVATILSVHISDLKALQKSPDFLMYCALFTLLMMFDYLSLLSIFIQNYQNLKGAMTRTLFWPLALENEKR